MIFPSCLLVGEGYQTFLSSFLCLRKGNHRIFQLSTSQRQQVAWLLTADLNIASKYFRCMLQDYSNILWANSWKFQQYCFLQSRAIVWFDQQVCLNTVQKFNFFFIYSSSQWMMVNILKVMSYYFLQTSLTILICFAFLFFMV